MDFNEISNKWDEILLAIKREYDIAEPSFNAWLKPLELLELKDNTLYIVHPEANDMIINIIKKKYEQLMKITLEEYTNQSFNIEFVDYNEIKTSNKIDEDIPVNSDNYTNSNLNPKHTFETFVVGKDNKFAQTASLAVAETPGGSYNPLYIHGGPGLGKTHLMHAIGNFIIKNDPSKSVIYVTSEEFTNEVIDSIRSSNNSKAMSRLREKYRNVDVLMIDDIQFIIGKESTQEEFFHTFNALKSAGKQIIITSDRPPKEMETLDERIKSRFEWGITADIGYPDYETRMAILKSKLEIENIDLSDEILDYIASNIKSNIREIEGALLKLKLFTQLEKVDITLDIAKEELQNIISPNRPKQLTPQTIIEVVADHYGISVDQMISKNRTAAVAKPRQIAMYLCREMTDGSLDAIGNLLGGRDHSTIIHGATKIGEEAQENDDLNNQLQAIRKKINPN